MGLYDQHLHSWHSFDCASDPRDNMLRALKVGLSGLTFTEHYDTHPEDWPTCRYDDEAYAADLATLRNEFGRELYIGKGIEVCYQPDRMDRIVQFLGQHTFDAVLLSIHWLEDGAIHDRRRWAGRTVEEMSRAYLGRVLEAVEMCVRLKRAGGNPFHILSHLDLVRRYSKRFLQTDDPLGHEDLVDAILRRCLASDLVPEINTSSLRQGLSEPMPGEAVVRRYAELGGTAIVLGSDAHTVQDIGAGLEEAAAQARRCRIEKLALFKNGRMETLPLGR
ncbi:MAG: histidinol-phosphatase HisJ family protein [Planctomycetota bacterium]